MKEIEAGEYFRTKNGFIGKIKRFIGKDPCFHNMNYYETDILYTMPACYSSFRIYEDMFKKHSKNIIDLIKVGDYVNGKYVRAIYLDGERKYIKLGSEINGKRTYEKDIKSIVTHERFKNIEYTVSENEEGG